MNSSQNKFFKVFKPYRAYWEEFIKSHKCFLRPKERELAALLVHFERLETVAEKMGINTNTASKILGSVVFKLEHKRDAYYKWIGECVYIEKGKDKKPTREQAFLTAALEHHNISERLYYRLKFTGCENLAKILLHYTIEDLRKIHGFGKNCEMELVKLFEENNCSELLQHVTQKNNRNEPLGLETTVNSQIGKVLKSIILN